MASMSTEIVVLRALLRLARRRNPATLEDLLSRVPKGAREVQHALASLARAQLVLRSGDTARLSLAGLAVAVAATANAKQQRAKTLSQAPQAPQAPRSRTARIFPMQPLARVRRHRAA